jgi:hypothetical protein
MCIVIGAPERPERVGLQQDNHHIGLGHIEVEQHRVGVPRRSDHGQRAQVPYCLCEHLGRGPRLVLIIDCGGGQQHAKRPSSRRPQHALLIVGTLRSREAQHGWVLSLTLEQLGGR